jgi:protein ImuB
MRRVVSLWLPTWPTDRLRKQDALPDAALVTAMHDGRKRVIAAVDAIAAQSGLYPGMPVAQGQALVPDLTVLEAQPEDDTAALRRVAGWCLRYAPLAAAAPPDGVWIDVTGSAHLQGGETRLLRDLVSRLLVQGFAARAAVADTPGAAHALARFGAPEITVVPSGGLSYGGPSSGGPSFGGPSFGGPSFGGLEAALARLPLAALRLPVETLEGLRLMGIEQIGALAALPRAPLVRRFGALVTTRLDQAFGRVAEAIEPEFPPELVQTRLTFVEPLLTAEAFATVIDRLITTVCSAMERSGHGARRLDLLFERVDGTIQAIRIGTARASRDALHLARLLRERIERIDPGLGVEAMRLVVPRMDALVPLQAAARLTAEDGEEPDIAPLIDRLTNRLGSGRVYRVAPVDSAVPERSVRQVQAQDKAAGTWPADLPRPVRLLDPPQPVEAMALLPDHPPMAFTWRRVRHRVRRADGPERIAGEWWKRGGETRSVRDYFRVEDEDGHRYWLFRRGDGENGITGDMRWFLHGFF